MSPGGPLRLGAKAPEAKAICVFVHGRGQSPEDMQSHVLARLAAPAVAFVLPRAPLGAWWDARAVDPLTPVARAQLSTALDHLAAALAAARAALPGLPLLPADARSEAAPAGVPVYLSGGDADPWIPVPAFADAAQSLGRQGARLRADLFPGRGHEVSDPEIAMLDGMLKDLAAGRGARMEAAR